MPVASHGLLGGLGESHLACDAPTCESGPYHTLLDLYHTGRTWWSVQTRQSGWPEAPLLSSRGPGRVRTSGGGHSEAIAASMLRRAARRAGATEARRPASTAATANRTSCAAGTV